MENIRNFSIIAHIDHGKTTMTDQLLRKTGTIQSTDVRERLMDSNPIEQERGITIKLAPVRMLYKSHRPSPGKEYTLNLIDTPGHVDFAYEVSRSLSACEGAILIVDAAKGIQAQTLANFDKAKEHGLVVIPVINKIDLESANPEKVALDLVDTFGFTSDEIIFASAKTGTGVESILEAVVERIPPPKKEADNTLKALVFNSTFHTHKGVVAFVKLISGSIAKDNLAHLLLYQTQKRIFPTEIGFFTPNMEPRDTLSAGEVGYIATGLKSVREVQVGDTLTAVGAIITPIPGYQKPQPMVFMDLYPVEADDFPNLTRALEKLALNDAALTYKPTASAALGNGYRVGYLGILHAEIVSERLSREFEVDVINTSPSVPYRVRVTSGEEKEISSPSDFPDPTLIKSVEEPIVDLTIYTPEKYVGAIMELSDKKRAVFVDMEYLGGKLKLSYLMPLSELITNYYDRLKSVSSGYASVQYMHAGYEAVDAVKVSILLNREHAEALAFISPRETAEAKARSLALRLKETIPRQQFEIPIQAVIGGSIIARETVKAFRKDVTAKLYGGDRTRRMKLLEKQKKGKKKMKMLGVVTVPQEAFTEILKV